jgi:hypothetical protein
MAAPGAGRGGSTTGSIAGSTGPCQQSGTNFGTHWGKGSGTSWAFVVRPEARLHEGQRKALEYELNSLLWRAWRKVNGYTRKRPAAAGEVTQAEEEPLTLGYFAHETSAAIAYDLAARVLKWDPEEWNFADEMIRDLLPIFGDEVVQGLDHNKELPSGLKDAMLQEMRRLTA